MYVLLSCSWFVCLLLKISYSHPWNENQWSIWTKNDRQIQSTKKISFSLSHSLYMNSILLSVFLSLFLSQACLKYKGMLGVIHSAQQSFTFALPYFSYYHNAFWSQQSFDKCLIFSQAKHFLKLYITILALFIICLLYYIRFFFL